VKAIFGGIVLVAVLRWQAAALAEAPAIPLGRYSAVTESEWSLDLDLKANGLATLRVASWDPGERNRANVYTYPGTWRVEEDQLRKTNLVVRFKDGDGVFTYHERLSFEEFGRDGSAPGFVGVSATLEPKLLVGRHLWLDKELRKLKW
jgi:hypothetical protein